MLASHSFENFKSLAELTVPLDEFTLLVGPNGCGKTSVLQGHALLASLRAEHDGELGFALGRPGLALPDPGRVRTTGSEGPVRVRATLRTDPPSTRWFELEASPAMEPGPAGYPRYVVRLDGEQTLTFAVGSDAHLRQHAFFAHRDVQTLTNATLLRLDPTALARPSYSEEAEPRLSADGAGLASVLAALAGTKREQLDAIEEDLRRIIPRARHIRTPRAEVVRTESESIKVDQQLLTRPVTRRYWGHSVQVEVAGAGWLDADLVSEGTLLVLGLLTAVHASPGGALLLDDLDRALHPRAQADLVTRLRQLQAERRVQILATTHSPYLLDCFDPAEVRVLSLDANGRTVCRRLSAHPDYAKWKDVMRAGELWSSLGEDWLVEGTNA